MYYSKVISFQHNPTKYGTLFPSSFDYNCSIADKNNCFWDTYQAGDVIVTLDLAETSAAPTQAHVEHMVVLGAAGCEQASSLHKLWPASGLKG